MTYTLPSWELELKDNEIRNLRARVAELERELLAYQGERALLKQEIESLRRNDPHQPVSMSIGGTMTTRVMTERERNQTMICKDCNEVFKRSDAALLPDSGGWKTVTCPRCKSTSIVQFHHEVLPTQRPGYRNR